MLQESKGTYMHTPRNAMEFIWGVQDLTRITSFNDQHAATYYLVGPRANATRWTLDLDGHWETNMHSLGLSCSPAPWSGLWSLTIGLWKKYSYLVKYFYASHDPALWFSYCCLDMICKRIIILEYSLATHQESVRQPMVVGSTPISGMVSTCSCNSVVRVWVLWYQLSLLYM